MLKIISGKYIVYLGIVKHWIMEEITLQIKYTEYTGLTQLPEIDCKLVNLAREATTKGYAPYSGFLVGAAVLLGNGNIITGNNQLCCLCGDHVIQRLKHPLTYPDGRYPPWADPPARAAAKRPTTFRTRVL